MNCEFIGKSFPNSVHDGVIDQQSLAFHWHGNHQN